MKIDEETLMAFADGELEEADREEVERALAREPELRAMLEEQQQLRRALAGRYGPVAQEEVPERLLAMLGASSHRGVPSLSAAREKKRPLPLLQKYGAIAATFAVGVLAGQLLPSEGNAPLESHNGALLARAELAAALETQLASAQDATSPTRIGLTFEDRQGRACRTFDTSGLSGLACRADGDWQILLASAAERQGTQFRQAGSPAVLEAAQEMMAGSPLDAEAERKAMKASWNISAARD